MKKLVLTLAATVVSLSTVTADAGGWGSNGGKKDQKALINVAPSVDLGKLNLLNGTTLLSGLNVSGILNGNTTGVVSGVLSGIGIGILGGNSYKLKKH